MTIKINKTSEATLYKKALNLEMQNKFNEAINLYVEIIKKNSKSIESLFRLSFCYFSVRDYQSALTNLNYIEKEFPKLCDDIFHQERSFALVNLKKNEEALIEITKSINLNPNSADSYNNRGNILNNLEKLDDSIKDFQKSILLNPKSADSYANLANVYKKKGEFENAIKNYNKAIEIDPNNSNFFRNRCIFYKEKKLFAQALHDADKTVILENSAASHRLKSDVYLSIGDYENAINSLTKAIKLNPNDSSLIDARASCYLSIDLFEDAERDYSYRFNNNDELTSKQKYHLSMCYLNQKKFDIGWKFYQDRQNFALFGGTKIITSKPSWDLKKTTGIVYVPNEQGLGDQILFSSLIYEASLINQNIILSVDPRLENLYKRSFKNIEIFPVKIEEGKTRFLDESKYDYFLRLGDLGGLFRNSIDSFSFQPSSFLFPDKKKSKLFRDRMLRNNSVPICGISWKSKSVFGEFKSLKLKDFMPIFENNEISFVNLQYGKTKEEISELKENYNVNIMNFEDLDTFNDIDSLASLIDSCDFIITTSNITAHLAGALGKTTYLFSPYGMGKIWYWRLHNGKNLWYPSITIIEQEKYGTCELEMKRLSGMLKDKNYG